MRALSIFFVTCLLICSSSCYKPIERKYVVKLENKSSTRLYNVVGVSAEGAASIYPDTSLPVNKPIFSQVEPHSTGYIIYGAQKIEKIFEGLPKDTLSVYVFNADSVDILGWTAIRNQYKVLKRYDLSFADLQQRNFIVTYP